MSNVLITLIVLGSLAAIVALAFILTWFLDDSPKAKARAARNQGYQHGYVFGKVWLPSGFEEEGMKSTYRSSYSTAFENEAYREGFTNGKYWGTKDQNLQKANREVCPVS